MLEVGILFSPLIHLRLNGRYRNPGTGNFYEGAYRIRKQEQQILLENEVQQELLSLGFLLEPEVYEEADFDLLQVTIGIHFHWERKEDQKFKGALKIIDEGEHLTAINILPLEEYLLSVISSEMSATSSPELLKAHAVISRSWLLAQKEKANTRPDSYTALLENEEAYIRWYDREDHAHFDVCADDHCQRYQGISKAYTPHVVDAIEKTRGEVLTYEGRICDTRFSKCCGGVTERFENTWEPVCHPYLTEVTDHDPPRKIPDLREEAQARAWICSSPPAFCNTSNPKVLSHVLNGYDQETTDFFRWSLSYAPRELSELVASRAGIDFGDILDIIPVERGASGRLITVKIHGSRATRVIGKELFIRKAFSPSHLYSSAFVVDIERDSEGLPLRFTFHGAGWGHGVGLCQIGAALMSEKGYNYREILSHYFPGTVITQQWRKSPDLCRKQWGG